MNPLVEWQGYEKKHEKKPADWYWALWIISLSIAATSIILDDLLLAIIVILFASLFCIFSLRPPRLLVFQITHQGVVIDTTMHSYGNLHSFWVEEFAPGEATLLLKPKKIMPLLVVPLQNADAVTVRAHLLRHLKEEELREPLAIKIMEYLGF
jgi:hypothetical protein